jgi:hypothetical protein
VYLSTTSTACTGSNREPKPDRPLDVVGRDLAAVDGGFVVELHAPAQVEHELGRGLLLPSLGEVRHDGEVPAMLLLGPVGEPDELAVDQVRVGVGEKAHRQMGIEVGRLPLGDAQSAAALGLLRGDGWGRGANREGEREEHESEPSGHRASS